MSKILIWRTPQKGGSLDIISRPDYRCLYETAMRLEKGQGNWGNKLWYQGILSLIESPENEITFRTNETPEEINDRFDLIIYPMANFFGREFCRDTAWFVKAFSAIHIPMYIIACGVQEDDFDHLEDLIKDIGDQAQRFIEAVYRTGGEFALRGYFTKEFFSRLGFPSAVVTGCPSLFQLGPDLAIYKPRSENKMKPIINGRICSFQRIFESMPESVYFSQDLFIDCLYDPNYFSASSIMRDIRFYHNQGIFVADLLSQGRIKLIADMNDWYHYIRENEFMYSFGTKIHGSIMPILAGIPATVLAIDSRTREMAEFFDIPCQLFKKEHRYTQDDLMDAYESADYTLFNERFKTRFNQFESFLQEHRIVSKVNLTNRFFRDKGNRDFELFQPNRAHFQSYAKRLKRERPILVLGDVIYRARNRM